MLRAWWERQTHDDLSYYAVFPHRLAGPHQASGPDCPQLARDNGCPDPAVGEGSNPPPRSSSPGRTDTLLLLLQNLALSLCFELQVIGIF